MAMGPTEVVNRAVYSRIRNDSDIIAELGSYAIYNTSASQFAPDDYIVFTSGVDDDDLDVSTQAARNRDLLYEMVAVSNDKTKAVKLSDLLDTAFHFQFLTLAESWSNIWIARERSIQFTNYDEHGRIIYTEGFTLRIRIEKPN